MTKQRFLIDLAIALAAAGMLYVFTLFADKPSAELREIKRCVQSCEDRDMLRVHTDQGCYCLDPEVTQTVLWEQ